MGVKGAKIAMLSDTETRPAPIEFFGPVRNSKRLIVDHIVLENFKSYAGRQVIGPFHQVKSLIIYVIFTH